MMCLFNLEIIDFSEIPLAFLSRFIVFSSPCRHAGLISWAWRLLRVSTMLRINSITPWHYLFLLLVFPPFSIFLSDVRNRFFLCGSNLEAIPWRTHWDSGYKVWSSFSTFFDIWEMMLLSRWDTITVSACLSSVALMFESCSARF